MDSTQNASYLVRFNVKGPRGRASGSLEIYWLRGDSVILFSPGLFGKGSLRGRWVLGESLLVYFPREKSYYQGGWGDFLLGLEDENIVTDSLIFGILSRRAFLGGGNWNLLEKVNGGWRVKDSLGSWERKFIFNRRGNLSRLNGRLTSPAVELEVEMDKNKLDAPIPVRLEWSYGEQKAKAKFEVERAVLNVEIPAAKKDFQIPVDAVRLEQIEADEEY